MNYNLYNAYLIKYPNGERLSLLKEAVNNANNEIFSERERTPEYFNMSCVLTACLIELPKLKAHMAHVGDTRLYRYTNRQLVKLSHDHSLVGYREEIGDLTEEEAMSHPQRNIIARDIGSEFHKIDDQDFIETNSFSFVPGNTLLLCSDGLCDMLRSSEIVDILKQEKNVKERVTVLIDKANEIGGKDNITVVLVDFIQEGELVNDTVSESELKYLQNLMNSKNEKKNPAEKIKIVPPLCQEKTPKKIKKRHKWILCIALGISVITFLWYIFILYKENNILTTDAEIQKQKIQKLDEEKISLESTVAVLQDSLNILNQVINNQDKK